MREEQLDSLLAAAGALGLVSLLLYNCVIVLTETVDTGGTVERSRC